MLRAHHGTPAAQLHSQEVLNNQTLEAEDIVVISRDREGRHREERKGQLDYYQAGESQRHGAHS